MVKESIQPAILLKKGSHFVFWDTDVKGRALACKHIAELAGRYGVAEKEVEVMLDEVAAAVEQWPEFARVAGVRGAVREKISRRLAVVRFGDKG